ncbi:NAD(P)-binding protein [Podospora aff. communis PSN243]|uniref:NAD(P)-binding protein n=1 Tax=Podospora aff. communis PSN243 TaxID=3040156 RepID=A0AAV9GUJ0_9PEZI|nr:NAD(P)-binding protein [Podospora aff. communis PSN243]
MSSTPLVALITAGTAGLGADTARLFAKSGIRVVVNYHSDTDRAFKLLDELQTISPPELQKAFNFHCVKGDLSQKSDIINIVDETVACMGRLDVVFSNGGWTRLRDITDLDDNVDEEDWDRCFNMNGVFITTASLAGVKFSGSSLAYAVTKAAQIHLAKGLATIAAPKIRVNTVSPGLMLTDWGLQFPPERREEMRERTKLKRLPTTKDVAEQVLCFVKSKSVTGVNAVIDGGMAL